MSFLDKKGRIAGLINPVDLVVLILIVVIGIKVVSDYRPIPIKGKERLVTMTLLVKNTPPFIVNSLKTGQDLFQNGSNAYLGKIYSKKAVPAEILLEFNGKLETALSPRNFDLKLVLKRKARVITGPSRTGIYFGKLVLRVGDHLKTHTLFTSVNGTVESLKAEPLPPPQS